MEGKTAKRLVTTSFRVFLLATASCWLACTAEDPGGELASATGQTPSDGTALLSACTQQATISITAPEGKPLPGVSLKFWAKGDSRNAVHTTQAPGKDDE